MRALKLSLVRALVRVLARGAVPIDGVHWVERSDPYVGAGICLGRSRSRKISPCVTRSAGTTSVGM